MFEKYNKIVDEIILQINKTRSFEVEQPYKAGWPSLKVESAFRQAEFHFIKLSYHLYDL